MILWSWRLKSYREIHSGYPEEPLFADQFALASETLQSLKKGD